MEGVTGMQRHAEEAESTASNMRGLTAEQWHDRVGGHVRQMLALVNRQMRPEGDRNAGERR